MSKFVRNMLNKGSFGLSPICLFLGFLTLNQVYVKSKNKSII